MLICNLVQLETMGKKKSATNTRSERKKKARFEREPTFIIVKAALIDEGRVLPSTGRREKKKKTNALWITEILCSKIKLKRTMKLVIKRKF